MLRRRRETARARAVPTRPEPRAGRAAGSFDRQVPADVDRDRDASLDAEDLVGPAPVAAEPDEILRSRVAKTGQGGTLRAGACSRQAVCESGGRGPEHCPSTLPDLRALANELRAHSRFAILQGPTLEPQGF